MLKERSDLETAVHIRGQGGVPETCGLEGATHDEDASKMKEHSTRTDRSRDIMLISTVGSTEYEYPASEARHARRGC
jgi:hypothetical protein